MICCIFASLQLEAQTNTVFYGPSPYFDFNGAKPGVGTNYSPFADQLFTWFYLETFQEGGLTVPGVTASYGFPISSIGADSVDGDNGTIDGSGRPGVSWFIWGNNSVTFSFDKDALGAFPTHAGVVWTDVGLKDSNQSTGYGNVIFEAFGSDTNLLGVTGPVWLGDGSVASETEEDRFFGVSDNRGIAAIRITMPDSKDWEVDHLQYGRQAVIVGGVPADIQLSPTNSAAALISWPSQSNTLYQVQWAAELGTVSNTWRGVNLWALEVDTNTMRNVGSAVVGGGSTNAVYDSIVGPDKRFYRVMVVQ